MYEVLERLATRPDPYSLTTVRDLWTRPHTARQMLAYHLDQDTHLASRPIAEIEEIVERLDDVLNLQGKRVCDLGCGPGLYALRLAERGAIVTGVDFSRVAIEYAESQLPTGNTDIDFLVADYLCDELPRGFDVVTLLYYDYCALSPDSRDRLLRRIQAMLNPGGKLVLDVVACGAFPQGGEQLEIEKRMMNGFWSDSDYVGLHRTWLYRDQCLSLDHYVIVEPADQWEILNWMQYFSPERLVVELEDSGYAIQELAGSLAGASLLDSSREIAVIAEAVPLRVAAGVGR